MASGLSRSFRGGHEEYVEWNCAQCETSGRNNDATFFCMDCNEHYCDDCLKPHKRIASLKLHKIFDKDQKEAFDKRFKEHEAELKTKSKQIQQLQAETSQLKANCSSMKHTLEKLKTEKDNVDKEHAQLKDECVKLILEKKQKDTEIERYSNLFSERLKHDRPDIVDLSDPNRAMQLAVRFGDLYNDTWTDAFVAQQMMGIPDKDTIRNLIAVLQECFRFCEEIVRTQLESLTNTLLQPFTDPRLPVKKGGLDQPRISTAEKKTLLDLRRQIMTRNVEGIIQAFLSHMHRQMRTDQDKKRMSASITYNQKCVEVCWLIVLHDPPLSMKTDVKSGANVDLNYFSVMSKGDKVDYLVWPALLNGEGGGLLAKGVVETVQVVKKKGRK